MAGGEYLRTEERSASFRNFLCVKCAAQVVLQNDPVQKRNVSVLLQNDPCKSKMYRCFCEMIHSKSEMYRYICEICEMIHCKSQLYRCFCEMIRCKSPKHHSIPQPAHNLSFLKTELVVSDSSITKNDPEINVNEAGLIVFGKEQFASRSTC